MRAGTRERYDAYRTALDETESALADWSSAAVAQRREAYAVYRAAAEREHAAAVAWLRGSDACDTFAAAQTMSCGKRPWPSTCEMRSGCSYGHSSTSSSPVRLTKNAELSRRR